MRHNSVLFTGYVLATPKIIKNENGELKAAMTKIKTMRGKRRYGLYENVRYDSPLIRSLNPEIIEKMELWEKGDLVEIKASLVTQLITKNSKCPHCGKINGEKGIVCYFNPIHVSIKEKGLDPEIAKERLKDYSEVSNQITIMGVVAKDIKTYAIKGRLPVTTYPLAVRRKYHIYEDDPDKKVDFPRIKSFGAIANSDRANIKKGTFMAVDGWVQTREINRTSICSNCNQEYEWHDQAVEIVPYASEYLRDFITEEEKKEIALKEAKKAEKRIYGHSDIDDNEDDIVTLTNEENEMINKQFEQSDNFGIPVKSVDELLNGNT